MSSVPPLPLDRGHHEYTPEIYSNCCRLHEMPPLCLKVERTGQMPGWQIFATASASGFAPLLGRMPRRRQPNVEPTPGAHWLAQC